jgi:hypothetical protein
MTHDRERAAQREERAAGRAHRRPWQSGEQLVVTAEEREGGSSYLGRPLPNQPGMQGQPDGLEHDSNVTGRRQEMCCLRETVRRVEHRVGASGESLTFLHARTDSQKLTGRRSSRSTALAPVERRPPAPTDGSRDR